MLLKHNKPVLCTLRSMQCMLCCWCNRSIQPTEGYGILKSIRSRQCDHCSCFQCLSEQLATTPPTAWISCPICKLSISSHIVGPNQTKEIRHRYPIKRDVYNNPSKDKDPLRHFMKHEENPAGKTMMYFVHVDENNGTGGRTMTATIGKDGEFEGNDSREGVISFARYLGRAFYGRGRGAETIGDDEGGIHGLIDYALQKCSNPGFRFLYNFANGKPLDASVRSEIDGASACASNLLACFAAHNILQQTDSNRKVGNRSVPMLQNAIGDLLYNAGCSRPVVNMLSKFRISASMSHVQREVCKGHVHYLEGISTPDPWDLRIYCNDNLDFPKNKGEKMENWVVQTVKHVRKDDPILAPCYNGKLGTEKKTLDGILESCEDKDPYAVIFGIRDIDYQRLAFYRLRHIEYCISHPFCHVNDLGPLIQQENPNLKRKTPPLRNLGIDVRAQKKWDAEGKRIEFKLRRYDPHHTPDDYAVVDCNHQHLLAKNGLTVDLPVKQPMSEKDTVHGFLEQYLATRQSQVADIVEGDEIPDLLPLSCKYIMYIGDGQPVYLAYRMKDEDHARGTQRFKPISVFPGAFHYFKEVVWLGSKLMQAFRRDLIKNYRKTDKEQEFVLFPRDPRQFEDEAIPYLAAKYRSAIEEFAQATEKTMLSASEVYDYMLEEAEEKWFAQLELNDIALHEIYFMIRDAIRANESELFFSAVRLSLPLFATTNAHNYLRIGFELLLWRETASEEELYLFENFAFTRLTEYGEFQAVDMCQEKVNKKFKEKLPEKALKGFETKMKNRAIDLNQEAAGKVKGIAPVDRVHLTFNQKNAKDVWEKVYSAVRQDMHKKQVWKRGAEVRFEGVRKRRLTAPMQPVPTDCIIGPGWGLMSNEIMDWFPKGIDRCQEYCQSFYTCEKEYRHQPERPQTYAKGGVPTTAVMSTEEDYKKDSDKRNTLAFSLNAAEIIKVARRNKNTIRAAISHTRNYLIDPPENPNSVDKVAELAEELVKLRAQWIAEETAKKNLTRSKLISKLKEEEIRQGASTSEKRRKEVIHGDKSGFFYKNHPSVKLDFNGRKQLINF